ncbi:hypothetical protein P3X46_025510 [Hevea brasiliensis]|uniref:BHLH domain-containing protein n=1 Tax=Hevea brasiliensis TaxID=3981 RepID=A0ABQ9L6W0_HEVBR|nr:hypothetical protein P3X46_025510 [Hevea brasiliensis]
MRNAVLPSVPSQIYNFGNNEVQITNLDVSMDTRNVYGSSFCLDFRVDGNQLSGESFAIPHQQYQSDCQFTSSSWEYNTQQSLLLSKKAIVSQDLDFRYTTTRKRSTEIVTSGLTDLIENRTAFGEWKKNKRRKASSSEEQWLDHQVKGSAIIKEHKVPVRRSQKLSDKITALQKLVSPYGKTDTASVLQEASLYIKILQEQIQNLLQMLRSSSSCEEIDGRLLDLQSRGLCLFPISLIKKLSQEHSFDTRNAYSIKPILNYI